MWAVTAAVVTSSCIDAPRESPPSEKLLPINGTQLFVKRIGEGETIVVVHGGPVLEHSYFLPHLEPLADSHELIFFDQRLSGRSAGTVDSSTVRLATFVDDIEALRESLDLGRIHLMGHSWGGLLAMRYAIAHPEQLSSLILVSSMAASSELWQREEAILSTRRLVEDSIEFATIRASDGFANGEPDAIAAILGASFKLQFSDKSKTAELNLFVPDDYRERSRQFGLLVDDLMEFDFHDQLREVATRTLIVYGTDEPSADLGGVALYEHFPASEMFTIDNAGHFSFSEKPEEFLDIVRRFLDSTHR